MHGECEIAVSHDRNGEFEPKVIEKRQTRTNEIEQKIMQMYVKGMSNHDIEDMLKQIYGAEITQGLVSKITDKILSEVNEWQNRPLEAIYPVVFFDEIVFDSHKDNIIVTKCVYSVLGINTEGQKEILGTWICLSVTGVWHTRNLRFSSRLVSQPDGCCGLCPKTPEGLSA